MLDFTRFETKIKDQKRYYIVHQPRSLNNKCSKVGTLDVENELVGFPSGLVCRWYYCVRRIAYKSLGMSRLLKRIKNRTKSCESLVSAARGQKWKDETRRLIRLWKWICRDIRFTFRWVIVLHSTRNRKLLIPKTHPRTYKTNARGRSKVVIEGTHTLRPLGSVVLMHSGESKTITGKTNKFQGFEVL